MWLTAIAHRHEMDHACRYAGHDQIGSSANRARLVLMCGRSR